MKKERERGGKKTIFLWPQFSVFLPHSEFQLMCLIRKTSNISRKVSRPAVGTMGSAQTHTCPHSNLYLLPKSTTAPKLHTLKPTVRI